MAIRVLIVDDHHVVAHGIERLLHGHPDIEVVGMAFTGPQALAEARRHRPSLALVDIALGGTCGLVVAQQIKAELPDTRLIMLSGYRNPEFVLAAMRLGLSGYVDKEDLPETLVEVVRIAAQGGVAFGQSIRPVAAALGYGVADETLGPKLSAKEQQVLKLLADRKSVSAVAKQLRLQPPTVRTLAARAHKKLGLTDRVLSGPAATKLLRDLAID
jgi:DNA-binding NarL/FixJ family response regulator